MRFKYFFVFLFLFISPILFCQSNVDYGIRSNLRVAQQGGYYDYAEPGAVNIHISLWGHVTHPGYYVIPANSKIEDLISAAGGFKNDAIINDIRLVRTKADSTQEVMQFKYSRSYFDAISDKKLKMTQLEPGDFIIVTGEPRYQFQDYFDMTLSVISVLTSVAILVLSFTRK